MNYRQTYKFREDGLGWQSVLFVVSDDYNELYSVIGNETDIFLLENIKQDLNTEEGRFAIDELTFSINQASCKDDNDLKALFFVMDASDIRVNRYCAIFFDDEPNIDSLMFIGKVNSKLSGEDLLWRSEEYKVNIDPLREYSFTALSFDISILEEARITGDIYKIVDNQEIRIDNISERWEANDLQAYKDVFKHRLFYGLDRNVIGALVTQYFRPLGNIYDVLNKYLELSENIINEKLNIPMTFNLLNSSLGISLQPTGYDVYSYGDNQNPIPRSEWIPKQVQNTVDAEITNDSTKAIYIHYKLVNPYIHKMLPFNVNLANSISNTNRQNSFYAFSSVADILFEIAKSFACYVRLTYKAGDNIDIEFLSRGALYENNYTYIIGVNDANFDTSSIQITKKNRYYSTSNNYAKDGFDRFAEDSSRNPIVSNSYEEDFKLRSFEKEKYNLEYEKLIFSISPTLFTGANRLPFTHCEPLNFLPSPTYVIKESWEEPHQITDKDNILLPSEYLHSGIFIELPQAPESEVNTFLNGHKVVRPASGLVTKIDGVNKHFNSLHDYVNETMARDKQYYEIEYSITVPYWNGFAKSENGSNPNWRNIKLGSKIQLSEVVKRYINNNWTTQRITRDYVVVGIERNLQQPETKLKLHSLERFAYGYWDGALSDLPDDEFSMIPTDKFVGIDYVEYEIHDDANPINCGDAVMIVDSNKIARTINISEYYGKTIGIALEAGEAGDFIKVQISGRVVCNDYNFAQPTGQVFARINNYGLNVTETILPEAITTENMVIILGKKVSNNSFILDIKEFIFLNEVVDA